MARKQVIVQLDDGLLADLDVLAQALGINRSDLLRRAARRFLADADEAIEEQKAIDSYRRIPEDPDLEHWTKLALQSWPDW